MGQKPQFWGDGTSRTILKGNFPISIFGKRGPEAPQVSSVISRNRSFFNKWVIVVKFSLRKYIQPSSCDGRPYITFLGIIIIHSLYSANSLRRALQCIWYPSGWA